MKIAMFTDSYYPRINGVSVSIKSYSEALCAMGHEILLVACNFDNSNNNEKNYSVYYDEIDANFPSMKILRVPTHRVFFSSEDKLIRVEYWKDVEQEVLKFNPNVIHMHSEFGAGILAKKYAKKYEIPLVYTFHTMWEDYVANYVEFLPPSFSRYLVRKLLHYYLKRADLILCPTERVQKVVKRYQVETDSLIFPTGISKQASLSDEEKSKLSKELSELIPDFENKKVLLYTGRVVKEKNLEFLLNLFEKLKAKYSDLVLVFVGGGPGLEELKSISEGKGLSENVFFMGYRPREELSYFYELADIFVFPSLTETQGLVTIEAMMSGTPVVAIGEMGTLDVMQGDNGGFMVKNDINEFYEKVVLLLEDKEVYTQKCEEALNWSKKWSIEELSRKLIKYYEFIITKKNSII